MSGCSKPSNSLAIRPLREVPEDRPFLANGAGQEESKPGINQRPRQNFAGQCAKARPIINRAPVITAFLQVSHFPQCRYVLSPLH